jgi:predicted lactoylglutathione lyase
VGRVEQAAGVTQMPAPRFTMVVLLVEDMERSVDFYRRLGVVFPDGVEKRRDAVVELGGGHKLVLTKTFGRNVIDYLPPTGDGRVMLEFFVDGDEAVDALSAELAAAGYRSRREPFRTDFGAYMALIDDPDGNTVLVTAG